MIWKNMLAELIPDYLLFGLQNDLFCMIFLLLGVIYTYCLSRIFVVFKSWFLFIFCWLIQSETSSMSVCTAVNDNGGGKYLLLIAVVFFKILAIEALTSPALLPACFVSYFTFFLFYKWLHHHILNKRISRFYL